MTVVNSQQSSPLAAQVLKVVGVLLILSFLVEVMVLLINPAFADPRWQLNFMTQLIDRGVTPLIGFALLYAGFWIQSAMATPGTVVSRATWQNSKFWAFVVASLLGLFFLLLIPLYLNATGQITEQVSEQINQEAQQAELQLQQQQQQLQALAQSGQIDQLLQSGQIPPAQVALLQQLQKDPKALDKQAEQTRQQVNERRDQSLSQARGEALRTRLRAGLRSLLLTIGFITIGWSGLRETN